MSVGLLIGIASPAGSVAQTFPDHRAAAVDQYGEPTPTPTPTQTPAPTQTPGGGRQAGAAATPSGAGRAGDEDEERGSGRDPSGLGIAPDSAGNPKPGSGKGVAGDVVPLTDPKGGRLPFTGLDLLTVALLGCALIALGSVLALAARRRRRAALVA